LKMRFLRTRELRREGTSPQSLIGLVRPARLRRRNEYYGATARRRSDELTLGDRRTRKHLGRRATRKRDSGRARFRRRGHLYVFNTLRTTIGMDQRCLCMSLIRLAANDE
jgi:hypothetical protein